MKNNRGFTLIELMIVVAIVGLLSAIALPAYQFIVTRSKVSEALSQVSTVKILVSESFTMGGLPALAAMVNEYNTNVPIAEKRSKYVDNIVMANDGVITVTLSNNVNTGFPADALGTTIVLTPNVKGAKLATDRGSVDWACATNSSSLAIKRGLAADLGTMPQEYAPPECR